MTPQQGLPPTTRTLEQIIWDLFGHPVVAVQHRTYLLIHPDGSVEEYSLGQNIMLVDGMVWNAGMLTSNPPVPLGVCQTCRYPPFELFGSPKPTHGLCTLANGRLCSDCGQFCCPAHRNWCEDGRWRCVQCASANNRTNMWKSVFFKREEV